MTTPIRVVLVDDQQLVRVGFRRILESEPDIEVVGEAADGAEALEVVRWRAPDVVLMDVQMPVMDGLEATRRLLEPGTPGAEPAAMPPKVIILTTFELDEYVFEALRAGASGFLVMQARVLALVEHPAPRPASSRPSPGAARRTAMPDGSSR